MYSCGSPRLVYGGRLLIQALAIALLLLATGFHLFWAGTLSPLPVIVGRESKQNFLSRAVNDYPGIDFIMTELEAQDRVLFLWDARAFYCDQRCIPDRAGQTWPMLYLEQETTLDIAEVLQSWGISHLFFQNQDLGFFLLHDQTGLHQNSANFLIDEFIPSCAEVLYDDGDNLVLELTCP